MKLAAGRLVKIQGPRTTFQTRSAQRLDLELAPHGSQESDAGRGPPRSPAKGSQHWGMTHYAAQIQSNFQQLIM